jgi:putative transcriptional regulator
MSLAELADRTGLTAANLAILRNGEAQALRVTTLEAICRELRCQPGDLLEYEAEEADVSS